MAEEKEEEAAVSTSEDSKPGSKLFDEEQVAEYLVRFARAEFSGKEEDEKAILLSLFVAPVSKVAFTAHFEFRQESGLKEDSTILLEDLLGEGKDWIEVFEERGDRYSDQLQIRLIDLLQKHAPKDADLAFARHRAERRAAAPDWGILLATKKDAPGGSGPSTEDEGGVETMFRRSQAQIHGLLVQDLETGRFVGEVSRMNATVDEDAKAKNLEVEFNQEVGEMMEAALHEVKKFTTIRFGEEKCRGKVEIAFEEQYSPKDGPSAALACALLLDSLISGDEINPSVALTGDLNADGIVKPVGGILGKIRGAMKGDRKLIAIPDKNAGEVLDLLIASGAQTLLDIQIFSVSDFEMAHSLTRMEDQRTEALNTAIDEFEKVQEVLNKPGGMAYLRNPHVAEKLRHIVQLAPNHLSARNLLLAATESLPSQFSLRGSLTQIDVAAEPLIKAIQAKNFDPQSNPFAEDDYSTAMSNLTRVRPMLDRRTIPCVDALADFSSLMREYVSNRPRSPAKINELVLRIRSAGDRVDLEYDKLRRDVDVQEELQR